MTDEGWSGEIKRLSERKMSLHNSVTNVKAAQNSNPLSMNIVMTFHNFREVMHHKGE